MYNNSIDCFMKKGIIFTVLLTAICLLSCNQSQKVAESIPQDTIQFLGRPIVDNDSIYEQIAAIAENDSMLSYSDHVLKIGEVGWGINVGGPRLHISLLTSVHPEAPEMQQVVQYLIGIYGEPWDNVLGKIYTIEDDYEYWDLVWPAYIDSTAVCKGSAHLRGLKSDEGGTVLFLD